VVRLVERIDPCVEIIVGDRLALLLKRCFGFRRGIADDFDAFEAAICRAFKLYISPQSEQVRGRPKGVDVGMSKRYIHGRSP
jgi:hypothetical protein